MHQPHLSAVRRITHFVHVEVVSSTSCVLSRLVSNGHLPLTSVQAIYRTVLFVLSRKEKIIESKGLRERKFRCYPQGLLRVYHIEVQSKVHRIYRHSPVAKWYLLNRFRCWRSLPFHKDIQR